MPKNKITTQGYFLKRLKDSGYYVIRLFDRYNDDSEASHEAGFDAYMTGVIFLTLMKYKEIGIFIEEQ